MSFGKIIGLDVLSPQTTQDVNNSRYNYSPSSSNVSTYAPVSTSTDARQLILVLNSAGATTNTKKQDSVAASSTPTSNPMMSANPNLSGGSSASTDTGQPSLFGGIFGSFSQPLLIGALIIGGVIILSNSRGKK